MRKMLVIAFLLSVTGGFGAAIAVADEAQDIEDATARAEEIFRLADQEKFNAMYDLIHPDAHKIVPRVVAVNTFRELYALAEAGRAEITNVEMGPWTWAVTGQEYEYAAHVSFEQPFVDENGDEQLLEDVMYLVQAEDGEWRWFFGGTREFVDLAIETFGEDEDETTPLLEGDLIQNTIEDLDSFYSDAFSYTDLEYETPGVVLVEQGSSAMSACGPAQTGFWAFYCPGDATVYLDLAFLNELGAKYPFAESFVIAHEWAHHVQTSVGLVRVQNPPDEWNEVFSIELELMADCMSGSWAQDLAARDMIDDTDINETVEFTLQYLGDPPGIDPYDPQAHGSAEQRAEAIQNGYSEGFLSCNIVV